MTEETFTCPELVIPYSFTKFSFTGNVWSIVVCSALTGEPYYGEPVPDGMNEEDAIRQVKPKAMATKEFKELEEGVKQMSWSVRRM